MKLLKITGLSVVLALGTLAASGQDITFGYDESGNRIERKIIVLNARAAAPRVDAIKGEETAPLLYRELKVYPNPTLGQVRVELPATENDTPFTYRVLATTGQIILSGQSVNGAVDFDLSAQPAGIYFVAIRNAGTSYNLQIVKQ